MKKLLFIIAAILPLFSFSQAITDQFTINGHIGSSKTPVYVYIFYNVGASRVLDSALIVNGSFEIKGNVLNPVNGTLLVDHKLLGLPKYFDANGLSAAGKTADVLSFFIEKGTINLTAANDSISKAKITGSKLNEESQALTAQYSVLNEQARKLNQDRNSGQNSPEFQRDMQARVKDLQAKQQTIFTTFVNNHPGSYLSLLVLDQMGTAATDPFEMDKMYASLDPSLKDMEVGKRLKTSIDRSKVTAIGAVAPDFTQPDVNGNPVKLSSFRGKYLLIDFWASWCGPCRMENPNVVTAYNKYKGKNFTILGVSLDKPGSQAAWQNAIKSDGLTWTQVSDLSFWGNKAATLYYVSAIPKNFLLDPNGKIIAKDLRGTDLDDKLAELFGKM